MLRLATMNSGHLYDGGEFIVGEFRLPAGSRSIDHWHVNNVRAVHDHRFNAHFNGQLWNLTNMDQIDGRLPSAREYQSQIEQNEYSIEVLAQCNKDRQEEIDRLGTLNQTLQATLATKQELIDKMTQLVKSVNIDNADVANRDSKYKRMYTAAMTCLDTLWNKANKREDANFPHQVKLAINDLRAEVKSLE